jgi:hypothetical protein
MKDRACVFALPKGTKADGIGDFSGQIFVHETRGRSAILGEQSNHKSVSKEPAFFVHIWSEAIRPYGLFLDEVVSKMTDLSLLFCAFCPSASGSNCSSLLAAAIIRRAERVFPFI